MITIISWIIVGLITGFVSGKIMGERTGTLMDITVGIAGALVGGFIMHLAGFSGQGGMTYTIFLAIVGAVLLI
jgi:uncharacterized membrane protein YeaQ/YmgE (transglycosylase-associated protein family)